jgi:uncharacterized protein DUF4399
MSCMNFEKSPIIVVAGLVCVLVGCKADEPGKAAEPSAPAVTAPAVAASPKAAEPTTAELNAFKPPTSKGKVYFEEPKDGAKISGKAFMGAVAVKLELRAEGMQVEAAHAVHENAGHFAVGIDAQPLPQGTTFKQGSGYQAYEKGETAIQVGLKPGAHTLTLQLVDARNRSYGPEWSQTVKIKVTERK